MATQNEIDILIRARDEASATLRKVQGELPGIGNSAKQVDTNLAGATQSASGLGTVLTSAAMVAGAIAVAKIAVNAAQAAIELGNLAEMNREVALRFDAFAGSAQEATKIIDAMVEATGRGVDDEALMRDATMLLSTELVTTSAQLASAARSALLLGDATQSAESRIQAFANILMTGSTRGLRQFGLSIDAVKQKTAEWQAANVGMTEQQARANAILEIAAQKADMVAAAGGKAVTSAEKLKTAWQELREEIAKPFATPVANVQDWLANQLNRMTTQLGGGTQQDQLKSLRDELAAVQGVLDALRQQEAIGIPIDPAQVIDAEKRIAELKAQIGELEGAVTSVTPQMDNLEVAMLGVAGAASQIAISASGAIQQLQGLAGLSGGQAYGFFGPGGAIGTGTGQGIPGSTGHIISPQAPQMERPDYYTYGSTSTGGYNTWLADQQKLARESADSWQRELSRAFDNSVSAFKSAFSEAQGIAKGLFDISGQAGGGGLAPGANGPFENMYRALAVAREGASSEYAASLGITQEEALRMGGQFERGQVTEEMFTRGLIDKDALIKYIKDQQIGKALSDAVYEDLARQAGVSGGAVKAMFGVTGADTKALDSAAKEVAEPIGTSLGDGLADEAPGIVSKLRDAFRGEAVNLEAIGLVIVHYISVGAQKSEELKNTLIGLAGEAAAAALAELNSQTSGGGGNAAGAGATGGASGATMVYATVAESIFAAGQSFVATSNKLERVSAAATPREPRETSTRATYMSGDNYQIRVENTAAATMLGALVAANRREKLSYSMGS